MFPGGPIAITQAGRASEQVTQIGSSARPYTAPAAASSEQLFEAWHVDRDDEARAELIERNLPLARKLAGRYARPPEPLDDLVQVASVGLIKAVERFDPNQGSQFSAFAVPTIVGELKRHFRDTTWSVRVGRRSQEQARLVRAAQRMMSSIGRTPTVDDLARFLECDAEDVLEGLQVGLAHSTVSLDAPAGGEDDGGPAISLFDTVGERDDRLERADDRTTLRSALRHIPKQERQVLYLSYGEDLSQREIARRIGVSQMQVSRMLRQALDGLRTQLASV